MKTRNIFCCLLIVAFFLANCSSPQEPASPTEVPQEQVQPTKTKPPTDEPTEIPTATKTPLPLEKIDIYIFCNCSETVSMNTDVRLHFGWPTKTEEQAILAPGAIDLEILIDGKALASVDKFWSAKVTEFNQDPNFSYLIGWAYNFHSSELGPGTHTLEIKQTFTNNYSNGVRDFVPGETRSGTITLIVMGESEQTDEESVAVTQIEIDGQMDDWEKYQLVGRDNAGDHVAGSPDIAEVRAFNNDQYLYILIMLHEDGDYQDYAIIMDMDGGEYDYQISVSEHMRGVNFGRYPITEGMTNIAGVTKAKGEQLLEIKMPLSVVGDRSVLGIKVSTWLGDSVGDVISDLPVLALNEVETLEIAEIEKQPTSFDMLEEFGEYQVTTLWQPELYAPQDLLVGPDGKYYIRSFGGILGEIYMIDPETGIIDTNPQLSAAQQKIVEGLNDPNETDLAVSPDGVTYKSYYQRGIVVRIEPDGSETTIVTGLNTEPIFIEFGPDGMLYINENSYHFSRVPPEGGIPETIKIIDVLKGPLALKDFGFDQEGRVVFVDVTVASIVRIDLNAEEIEIIVPASYNTPAITYLPGDELLLGLSQHYPINPSRIIILKPDGTEETILENVPGWIYGLAFSPNGEIYGTSWAKTRTGSEFWLYQVGLDGTLEMIVHQTSGHIPWLLTLSYDPVHDSLIGFDHNSMRVRQFFLDGSPSVLIGPESPYANTQSGRAVADQDGGIWLMFVDGSQWSTGPVVEREFYYIAPDGKSELVAEIPINGCCTVDTMAAGFDGYLYIEADLFGWDRVGRDGAVEKLMVGLPTDPLGLVITESGDIIFTSPLGIFMLSPIE